MERWRNESSFHRQVLPPVLEMKIRFCEHNKGKGKAYRRLKEEYPDLNIKIKKCIKECGTCSGKPMATVNKDKISASTGDDLYRKIADTIKKA